MRQDLTSGEVSQSLFKPYFTAFLRTDAFSGESVFVEDVPLMERRSFGLLSPILFKKDGDLSIELPSESVSVTVERELFMLFLSGDSDFFTPPILLRKGLPFFSDWVFSLFVTGVSA